ncbi:MAG: hypothetical protein MI924_34570 [Chloroflexales bacterium]|nr:hypothetical protein [Chloroflexales bacterium]
MEQGQREITSTLLFAQQLAQAQTPMFGDQRFQVAVEQLFAVGWQLSAKEELHHSLVHPDCSAAERTGNLDRTLEQRTGGNVAHRYSAKLVLAAKGKQVQARTVVAGESRSLLLEQHAGGFATKLILHNPQGAC